MKSGLFIVFVFFSSTILNAQVEILHETGKECMHQIDSIGGQVVMEFVDTPPEFKDGIEVFYKNVQSNIQLPDSVQEINAKFILSFIIETNGEMNNLCFVQPAYTFLNLEFLRDINRKKKWKAGSHKGIAVPVKMVLPMYIELR